MKKIDPFETLNDGEWLLVHSGAVTNTNPGSLVEVRLNTERICPNMTNAEFREIVMIARDRAIPEIRTRIDELHRWTPQNQSEVKRWFGRADETTRARLTHGLIECIRVLTELTPYNFTRHDSERFKHIGCVPNINKESVSAEVCAPDTATHAIAIHRLFCELPTFSWRLDSMSSVLFHESTHFSDTFGSFDHEYGLKKILDSRYGEKNPDLAINNADSITGYVFYKP